MTYIEFFDQIAAENISACLTYAPDRVIYITDNARLVNRHINNYQKIFTARGQDIDFQVESITKNDLDTAVELLTRLVNTYDDCVFDITGGEEIFILALGIVYAQNPDKKLQIHKFNLRNNMIYDCDKDGVTIYRDAPMLTVEENIRLYGGEIIYGTVDEEKTCRWDLTPEFLNDVNLIWDQCKENVGFWNLQVFILEGVEAVGNRGGDDLTTVASCAALEQYLEEQGREYKPSRSFFAYLIKHGLLTYIEDDGQDLTVSYKNPQIKKCLTKAGRALEMKIYTLAAGIQGKNGLVYQDAMNGVLIDWDGEIHDETQEEAYDTKNEMDVFLMHGTIPVFISCKSGLVLEEELYKLNTVADRFGDQYAKKVLITTSLAGRGDDGKYILQRATDMNIKVIDGVQHLTDKELEKKLKNLWSNG